MRTSTIASLGLATLAAASPVRRGIDKNPFPLSNGFPSPSPQQLLQIEQQAHGTLSNATPPATASEDTIYSLSLIAVNEFFEVAYFSELLSNVTNNEYGFKIEHHEARQLIIDTLTTVTAQEELHVQNAVGALAHFGAEAIAPCTAYNFPVANFEDSISLVVTFTSLVMGTLQDVIVHMGASGDSALTRGVASVVGQEGEQNGYWRLLDGRLPSDLPFMTTSVRDFAFNALNQTFLVPGACGNLFENPAFKNVHPMAPLNLLTPFDPKTGDETIRLSFETTSAISVNDLVIAYINQQNVPVTQPLTVYSTEGSTVTVETQFPFKEHELNGLTIGALVKATDPLANAQDVSDATFFGPILMVVN